MTKKFTLYVFWILIVAICHPFAVFSQAHVTNARHLTLKPNQKLNTENIKKPAGTPRQFKFTTLAEGDCSFVLPAFPELDVLYTYTDPDAPNQADGYVVGTNPFDDLQKAEFYDFSGKNNNNFLHGVIIYFFDARTNDPTKIVTIRVFDGTTNTVGAELGHTDLEMSEIIDSVDNNSPVPVDFAAIPLPASKKVFISVDMTNLDYYEGDFLAVFSSSFNELPVNTGWEQWSDDNGDPEEWHQFSEEDNYNANVSIAFIPLIGFSNTCEQIVPLPIKLNGFTASKFGSANKLEWTTATEAGNKGFEVQRSEDGVNFSTINFVASKANGGNSNAALNYSFTDNSPLATNNYYRVKQVDLNARATFSKTLLLVRDQLSRGGILAFYPNPAKNYLQLIVDLPAGKSNSLIVVDMAGKTLIKKEIQGSNGNQQLQLNISSLSKGTYFVKTNGTEGNKLIKFVKE